MSRWWKKRFDLVEIGLPVLAILGVAFAYSTHRSGIVPSPEGEFLESAYGPSHNSQHNEEWIIRDFFGDEPNGVFVDVGANHYQDASNTYYLETELGWSGLAVEPIRAFAADYATFRPATRFVSFFVSDVSNELATLYVQQGMARASSGSREFTERYGTVTAEVETPTITMNDLLAAEGIAAFDLLTIDIELHEPAALAGLDIQRYGPRLVCIEAHPEVRQEILDYFQRNNYVLVGKYLRADVWNMYFTPAGPQ